MTHEAKTPMEEEMWLRRYAVVVADPKSPAVVCEGCQKRVVPNRTRKQLASRQVLVVESKALTDLLQMLLHLREG